MRRCGEVDDAAIADSVRWLFYEARLVAEPGGGDGRGGPAAGGEGA